MKSAEGYIHDTPEQIQRCLNCTAPPERCSRCAGDGGNDRPYTFHAPDIRKRAVQMMGKGMTPPRVAEKIGVNKSTVYYWQRMMRKKKEKSAY